VPRDAAEYRVALAGATVRLVRADNGRPTPRLAQPVGQKLSGAYGKGRAEVAIRRRASGWAPTTGEHDAARRLPSPNSDA